MLIDHIPVIYIKPEKTISKRKLAIFLTGLGSTKEDLVPYLSDIAGKGFIGLAFDNYQHGERGTESGSDLTKRVFSNMRRFGWPILGQTIIDTEKVIDWAIANLDVLPQIYMGGISMGGDISIAAAGIDSRIVRVAPIVTTPDWLRPGMHNLIHPDQILDQGKPDNYAQFFYDQLNPMTHLSRYINCPPMKLILGEKDNHIPPENAERFRKRLSELSPQAAKRIELTYIHGTLSNHVDTIKRNSEWWPLLIEWWLNVEPCIPNPSPKPGLLS
jgi:dienelactone hydrolase